MYAPKVYAASDQINIYPAIYDGGMTLYDFGWHFDETGYSWFGAQDYSPPNYNYPAFGDAILYAAMVQSSGVAWDYYVSSPSSCKVHAILRYWNGS
jgi:hypothetical protein